MGGQDAVDTVYETMVKEQQAKREKAEGCGMVKFESFHKDLRKVKSHGNSAGFGTNSNLGAPKPAENFVGFDSMNIANSNKENLNYIHKPDPAPTVSQARPQFEKFTPDMLQSEGGEMNPMYTQPDQPKPQGAGRQASEKNSERSEKFNNCDPKDNFQGALRDNKNNFINNEDRNLVTN